MCKLHIGNGVTNQAKGVLHIAKTFERVNG